LVFDSIIRVIVVTPVGEITHSASTLLILKRTPLKLH